VLFRSDYLALRFAADGYDLRKFIRFVMTSRAYQSRAVILPSEPGADYVYAGPLAKRMTAEQLIDSIWLITGTNPSKPTAKVDRAKRKHVAATEAQRTKPLASIPVNAKWIWNSGPVQKKIELRKRFKLETSPTSALMMATCDNAFTMRINGTEVASSKDWTKPVYRDVAQFLRKGQNVIEIDAEMFGGSAGFICQLNLMNAFRPGIVTTDKTWECRQPKGQWRAVAELKPHGAGPWGTLLNSNGGESEPVLPTPPVRAALVQNDFLMRSLGRPHRDQVVTTRPGELTTLQAIDLSNGDILAGYLSQGARHLVGQGKSSEELIEWLYRYALSREATFAERTVLAEVAGDGRNAIAVEDILWMVFMQPEFQFVR
jgi:hypothetical protein